MNPIITRCRQVILAMTVLVTVNVNAVEAEKCKPCAAAAAARASVAAAAAASLAAGKPVSREMELDIINTANTVVEACCAYCAQVGSLGCQGENSARCNTCQAGLIKMSIAEAAAAALAVANTIIKKRKELDPIPTFNLLRAPRQELPDPCNTCETVVDEPSDCEPSDCSLNCKLQALFDCCVNTNIQLRCQGNELERCCKKLRHKIEDVEEITEDIEELVESQIDQSIECCSVVETRISSLIDQSAECCSIIETRIGDLDATSFGLQNCALSVVDFVDTTDADVITWLKSIYVLLYQVFQCTCCLN